MLVASQKRNRTTRLSLRTAPSIAVMKSRIRVKNRIRAAVRLVGQVRAGVDHDERADAGDEQREKEGEAVEPEREIDPERRRPGHLLGYDAAGRDFLGEAQECRGQPAGRSASARRSSCVRRRARAATPRSSRRERAPVAARSSVGKQPVYGHREPPDSGRTKKVAIAGSGHGRNITMAASKR